MLRYANQNDGVRQDAGAPYALNAGHAKRHLSRIMSARAHSQPRAEPWVGDGTAVAYPLQDSPSLAASPG